MDPPSSSGFVVLARCSVGTRKIGEDGVVVLRSIEVLRAGNWLDGGLAALKIGEIGGDSNLGSHSGDFHHGIRCDSSSSRRVAILALAS